MRLFLAIELPEEIRTHLVSVRDELKRHITRGSFPRDENLHITLKFLGDVEAAEVSKLSESMHLVRAGGPINLSAQDIECFPERGPIRVVAAQFGGDLAGMKSVHQSVEQRCRHLGFERETRAYRPHVTLVRARPTLDPGFRKIADSFAAQFPGPSFDVDEFSLVESRLRAEGSEYNTLGRFRFIEAS